ncbi:MAG: hypothetical protein ACOCYB_07125 [Alkalispirochaeta sp.]
MSTTVHILPHTHWDREWFVPSSFTREWLVPFFTTLFTRFEEDPHYRFTLDGQSILLEDYVAQLSAEERRSALNRIARLVHEGRLTIGPYYQQPDWQLVSGEALLRNLLIGIDDTTVLGARNPVGWLMDNFGQISQCVQIHEQCGINAIFAWRGFDLLPTDLRSELIWSAPDGSRLPVIYLVDSYRNGMRLFSHPEILQRRLADAVARVAPFATDTNVLLMNGYDQEMEPELPDRTVTRAERTIRVSSPQEYVAAKRSALSDPSIPHVHGIQYSGRFISIFPGILSARGYLKTANSLAQTMHERYVEPLAILAAADEDLRDEVELLWRMILQNHPHDTICGVSSDPVHEEAEIRFSQIHRKQMQLLDRLSELLLDSPDRAGGAPVYFNPSIYPQRPVLASGVGPEIPPLTVASISQHGSIGEDLPPVAVDIRETTVRVDNGVVTATLARDGTISIFRTQLGTRSTVQLTWRDGGDAGDTYNFDQPADDHPQQVWIRGGVLAVEEERPGRTVVSVSGSFLLPTELSRDRRTRSESCTENPAVVRLELRPGDDLAYCTLELQHASRDHRMQLVAAVPHPEPGDSPPLRLRLFNQFYWDDAADVTDHPTPFNDSDLPEKIRTLMIGAREPGLPVSVPSERGFLMEGPAGGAVVVHRGLHELERLSPTSVALTVVRAVGWLARTDLHSRTGDAGPEIFTPDAQCNRSLTATWAVTPTAPTEHADRVEDALTMRRIERFFAPPIYLGSSASPIDRSIIPGFSAPPDSALGASACKIHEAGTGIVLRLFNPGSNPIAVSFPEPVRLLSAAEHPEGDPPARDQRVQPGRIATFELPFPVSPGPAGVLSSRRKRSAEARFRYAAERWYPDCTFGATVFRMSPRAWSVITHLGSDALHISETASETGTVDQREEFTRYILRTLEEEYARRTRISEAYEAARAFAARAETEGERIVAESRVSTLHRQFLEVELSILFARRHAGLEPDLEVLRTRVRDIALELNHARVAKRTHDYHVALVQSDQP